MISYKNPQTRRELIMKHYSSPHNKVAKIDSGVSIFSKVCVDELHLKITWENDHIVDTKFSGIGCAIFLSSTDIMLDLIKNKTKQELMMIMDNYRKMINNEKEYNDEVLGKLVIFENVKSHLNRLHCAEMILLALEKEILKK